jgi:hypothetical protein
VDQNKPTDSPFPAPEPALTDRVPTPTPQKRGSSRLLNVALGAALVLAVAGVAFAGGRMTAPASAGTITPGNGLPGGFPGGGVFNGNGGPRASNGIIGGPGGIATGGRATIEGTVEAITDTTLTLKTADGQTIQIALDGTTTYHAQTDASADDVRTGGKVQVRIGFQGAGGTGVGTGAANLSASDVTVVP